MIRGEEYFRLMEERPHWFKQDDALKIVTARDEIEEWEAAHPGQLIGIPYKSEWHYVLVDLVQEPNGVRSAYERVMHSSSEDASIIVPMVGNDFLLIRQYRHATRGWRYCFPRGFGEVDLDGISNSYKDVARELGGHVIKVRSLGFVEPDNGLAGTRALVTFCRLDNYDPTTKTERIDRIVKVSPTEMNGIIANGDVEDGLTIAAYMMFCLKSQYVK